jgi:hypothetical protein
MAERRNGGMAERKNGRTEENEIYISSRLRGGFFDAP